MNCEKVRPLLLDYVLDEASAEIRAEVDAHVEQCAACSIEVGNFQQTLGHLKSDSHFSEIPQGIRLVAEPPNRWVAFWSNPARLVFAASAFACLAIALLAFFQTNLSYEDGHLELAFGGFTRSQMAAIAEFPASIPAASDTALGREEVIHLVAEAITASEVHQQHEAERLVQTVSEQIMQQRLQDRREFAESLRYFEAGRVTMWKQQVQNQQYMSKLIEQSSLNERQGL